MTFVSHVASEIHRSERFSGSVIELCSLINPFSILRPQLWSNNTMAQWYGVDGRMVDTCIKWNCYHCNLSYIIVMFENMTAL